MNDKRRHFVFKDGTMPKNTRKSERLALHKERRKVRRKNAAKQAAKRAVKRVSKSHPHRRTASLRARNRA